MIDWSVLLSISVLDVLTNIERYPFPPIMHLWVDYHVLFPLTVQGFLVSYDLNTLLAKTSTVVTYLMKVQLKKLC